MKYQSIIWTYILFSILHISGEENSTNNGTEIISAADRTQQTIDSVYSTLSMSERVDLLSVFKLEANDSLPLNKDSSNINGIVFNPNETKVKQNSNSSFQNETLKIAENSLTDSIAIGNLALGQTGRPRLAFYGKSIELEKLKERGVNISLDNSFETYQSDWKNIERAYQQSPLLAEKYWQQVLAAGESNGIKIGINDFFFENRQVEKIKLSDFIAIGMSGNRFYSRKGHGFIQLSDDLEIFKERFSRFKLSSRQSFLRTEMDFKGIILSEDLSTLDFDNQKLKAILSFKEGSDMVCISANLKDSLKPFLIDYFSAKKDQLKEKCLKVLKIKHELHTSRPNNTSFAKYTKPFAFQMKQAALTCVKSDNNILPIQNLVDSISLFSTNVNSTVFNKQVGHYAPFKQYAPADPNPTTICLLDGYGSSIDDAIRIATNHSGNIRFVLITDALTFHKKRMTNFSLMDGVLLTSDTTQLDKELAIQAAFGAFDINGKLPFFVTPLYKQGHGEDINNLERLSYIAPEYIGINSDYLTEIDKIAKEAIAARALPGCQIVVGYDGNVIYEKNFGHHDYSRKQKVQSNTIYDIASISKIAASTVSLMALQGQGKFSLNDSLYSVIPEVVGNNPMKDIWLKDMMAHQAGLPAWIPFYVKTLSNKKPSPTYYSSVKKENFTTPVAEDLWIRNDYPDTMYSRILSCRLKSRTYKYSDLGYYFVKKIIEKQGGLPMEDFADQHIYKPLGLQTMTYNPYLKFPLSRIAPTEDDKIFRKQTVHGYVHDPGSAMMGGVCGHAGVFSTANDLTILMQMLMNKGTYGGKKVLDEKVINEYTSVQFPGRNRRGAGFDKPNLNGSAATASSDASPGSFGHSGFTGTLTWADPEYKINYVFLSNRVNPSAENWKIVRMNIRTRIQSKIYKSVKSADTYNFLASI